MTTYKVSLTVGSDIVIFQASSPVTEGRTANYDGFNIVHLPTELWSYRNTSARHFEVTGKLVSRNTGEATANSRYVDLIRSWVLPDFGTSGATPPIVKFSAYYNTNITNVPCVIRAYSITFPDDVDWVFDGAVLNSGTGVNKVVGTSAMPVICVIGVTLEEAYSAQQITARAWKMNLSKLKGAFVQGGSADDVTAGGGSQGVGSPLTTTPSMTNLAPGYTGIMGTLTTNPSNAIAAATASNGSNIASSGIVPDTRIVSTTVPGVTAGLTPNSISGLTTPSPTSTPLPLGMISTGYPVNSPTSVH